MGHRKGNELLPVLRAGEPPRGFQLFVQGRRRKRGHQAKDRQPRRPTANFLQCSLGHSRRVIDRKSTRLNSSHGYISYAVFCLKKKKNTYRYTDRRASPVEVRQPLSNYSAMSPICSMPPYACWLPTRVC